jgi:hypothetical protein
MEKGNVKVMGITAGTIGSIMAAAVAWGELDLPRPAWLSEVEQVRTELGEQIAGGAQFAVQTRLLVLGQEWERLDREIEKLENQGQLSASDRELLSKKRLRKRTVSQQLQALASGS